MCPIKHRGGDGYAIAQILAHLDEMIVFQRANCLVVTVDRLKQVLEWLHLLRGIVRIESLADLAATASARPAEMGLQDLAHIHAARHPAAGHARCSLGAV